jgi:hypothetical protein
LGVAVELTPSVSFEFGQENNNTMDAKSYGKLTVKLPLGNKQKFTNFATQNITPNVWTCFSVPVRLT